MRPMSSRILSSLAGASALVGLVCGGPTLAAEQGILSGAVTSVSGEPMGGVTVSAKAEGMPITTSVFTDESGRFYFPPLAAGKYRVWAQALSFETARGEVQLAGGARQDFRLQPMEDYIRQLPGDVLLKALPEDTPDDRRLKQVVRNNCTSCHTPSYPLQFTFDEAGWDAILDLMAHVNVHGVYQGPESPPHGIINFHRKELAAYLARARGPGESSLKVTLPPRPSGEAARVVWKEYDVPLDPDAKLPAHFNENNGSDWSLGTPSKITPGYMIHDAWADLDGNLWFTSALPNRRTSIGRIDPNTGAVRTLKIEAAKGFAAPSHGITRDPKGAFWFNANPGRGGLARLDPKTERISVYIPPEGMSPTGGATTVDWDGKGRIWVSSPDGALRFDPETSTFTEFKSATFKTKNGVGTTYGVAADRNGNGWWAEMQLDIVGKGDSASGKSLEVKLDAMEQQKQGLSPEALKFYESFAQTSFDQPFPWAQGPRRMGVDKEMDVLWVGNSWGGNLARIDVNTNAVSYVALPDNLQPYHVAVDAKHNAWTNVWMADKVLRYDAGAQKWTAFELPSRGTEARYISLLEKDGGIQVIVPEYRLRRIAVMTSRSEAELETAKRQAQP